LLSSSNPNVVAVPPSATIGSKLATFTATMPSVLQPGGTATLNATLDGATASLPVTVQLPQPQQVSFFQGASTNVLPSALPSASMRVEALFNGKLAPGATVNFASSDTSLAVLAPVTSPNFHEGMGNDQLRFSRLVTLKPGISQQRQATITATYGSVSKTASITLIPITISSFTATPTSGVAGGTLTLTALLSTQASGSMHVTFASGDTARVVVNSPAAGFVSSASKSATVLLKGPVSSPRQVPIMVTLRAGGSNGPIVSTQTLVVTVNP
jgi:hypothetical protein